MAGRSVVATLAIDGVQGVVSGFRRAGAAATEYAAVTTKAGDRATAWVDKNRKDLDTVSGGLLKVGAVGGVALIGLAKAAIDWESAWAGVTKTVDGTPDQLASIESGLRDLAKTLPATHEEIAAVAEAAGQLGVKTDSIVGFTKVMIDLGETTNLTADEAATSLAQLMNVMGTSADDVSRLGSSIVALGNDGASTERDIVAMAQRIAAAGKSVRMSETDVLGFASALSSTGIEAEAGGTAISKTFRQIDAAVRDGGSSLKTIAKTSGMTAEQFRDAWETDAAGAVASFVEGLGGMQASGEDANGVLKDLKFNGERQTDVLMRLANATKNAGAEQDLLRESLDLGKSSWDDNMALVEEAQKRYETTGAQIQMAINGIKDTAIDLGATLLPVIDQVLSFVNTIATAFANLPDPAKGAITSVLLIGTSAALSVGGVMKLVTGLSSAKTAINGLGLSVGTATKAMGLVGIAIAAAGTVLAAWSGQQAEAKSSVEGFSNAIREQNGLFTEATRLEAARQANESGMLETARLAGASLSDVTEAILGNEAAYKRVQSATEAYLATQEAGSVAGDAQSQQLATQAKSVGELTGGIEELQGHFAEAAQGNRDVAEAAGKGAAAIDESAEASAQDAEAKRAHQEAISLTADEMKNLLSLTQAYGNELLAQSGSAIAVESSIADVREAVSKSKEEFSKKEIAAGKALDITTEAGRRNQQTLDDLAKSSMGYVETLYEQGAGSKEIEQATARAREQWVAGAEALGMSKDRASELADAYFAIPSDVATSITADDTDAQARVKAINAALATIPPEKKSEIKALLNQGKLNEAEAKLRGLTASRTVYLDVQYQKGGYTPSLFEVHKARGGVVDYYAAGGLRERHVAEIAPAGAVRVWAEPETGGEAYIPLAVEKRSRSLRIWHETGRRLGVHGYADGALLAAHSLPHQPSPAGVIQITQDIKGPDPRTVAAELMALMRHELRDQSAARR